MGADGIRFSERQIERRRPAEAGAGDRRDSLYKDSHVGGKCCAAGCGGGAPAVVSGPPRPAHQVRDAGGGSAADVRLLRERCEPDTLLLPSISGEHLTPPVRIRRYGHKDGVSEQERMNAWELAFVVVASYLIGAIPAGYILGSILKGIDIRDYGSGVTGATNVLRVLGRGPFVAVLVADALKGFVPTLVTWYLFHTHDLQVASGIAAVI